MRPSISVTLEPGLERGVPWGRDLYTFVTSAAGHMMRTLQKPRKNRPSKRQVNHRRFLHNMIQRKFADIEASNHRLASALYFKDEEKNVSSPPSEKPKTLDQTGSPTHGDYLEEDPDKSRVHTDEGSVSNETEISEKKQPNSGHLWKRHLKTQPTNCTAKQSNQSKERQKKEIRNHQTKGSDYQDRAELLHSESYDDESQLRSDNNLSEDSGFIQFDQNMDISPSFSPEISPFSLESCDFSMFTDTSSSAPAQKSIADISESQWTDIMDLFSSKELGGCVDVEAYFESICACEGDAGQEAAAADVGFAVQSDSFRSDVKDLHHETGKYRYEYSCQADQGSNINHFHSDQMSNEDAAETQFNQEIIRNQLCTASCQQSASELQAYQQQSPCMMGSCENNQNFTPFEGVAQSFSVPLHHSEQRLVLTPLHDHDWLFTDILQDTKSADC